MRKETRRERPNEFEEIEDAREDEREDDRDDDRSELGSTRLQEQRREQLRRCRHDHQVGTTPHLRAELGSI